MIAESRTAQLGRQLINTDQLFFITMHSGANKHKAHRSKLEYLVFSLLLGRLVALLGLLVTPRAVELHPNQHNRGVLSACIGRRERPRAGRD